MFAEAAEPPVEIGGGTAVGVWSLHLSNPACGEARVEDTNRKKDRPPPAVFSADPEAELEDKLQRNPNDLDAKVDVGSDESMDASDPPSVVRPGNNEPVPSSGSPNPDKD